MLRLLGFGSVLLSSLYNLTFCCNFMPSSEEPFIGAIIKPLLSFTNKTVLVVFARGLTSCQLYIMCTVMC
jgi:hypothetical protein